MLVDSDQPVELIVVNTCCITTTAMRKSRQAIRRCLRSSPDAWVLVTGCYSDYDATAIHKLLSDQDIDENRLCVTGHHDNLAQQVDQLIARLLAPESNTCVTTAANPDCMPENLFDIRTRRLAAVKRKARGTRDLQSIKRFDGHQRAFVKVQDGCDAFCTYCVVPYTRCNLWSRPAGEVLDECRTLINNGHREIVLSGVFVGAYGRQTSIRRKWDDSANQLPDLLAQVAELDGLWRVRLSSLEPGDCTDELLNVYKEKSNVAPHLHLPLQSGSTSVLKRMNRQYSADEFCHTIDRIREALDRPSITTDIIVGFIGESDEEFAETLAVARHAAFAKIHAFPFSAIPGTSAWTLRDQAPSSEQARLRMQELTKLERELATAYREQFIGQTFEALVESTRPQAGIRQAMTDRYLTVTFPFSDELDLTGQIVRTRITGVTDDGLSGEIA